MLIDVIPAYDCFRAPGSYIYIGWMKLKVYCFILCSIVYVQNALFAVIPFHDLSDCDHYTPRDGETERAQNQELVTKRGIHL